MKDGYEFEGQRLIRTYERFFEEIDSIRPVMLGRYAPELCYCDHKVDIADIRTFVGCKEDFLSEIKKMLLNHYYQPETVRKYVSYVKEFLDGLVVPFQMISFHDIFIYIKGLYESKRGIGVIYQHLSALRTIFDKFFCLDFTMRYVLPKVCVSFDELYNENELKHLVCAADRDRDRLLILTVLSTGFNLNEIRSIRKKDINPLRCSLSVCKGVGRKVEDVEISNELMEMYMYFMKNFDDDDYIFSSIMTPQKPLSGRMITKMLKGLAEKCGFSKLINFRILRKSSSEISKMSEVFRYFYNLKERVVCNKAVASIKVDDFQNTGGDIQANAEVILKSPEFREVCLDAQIVNGFSQSPHVVMNMGKLWDEKLLWLPVDVQERVNKTSWCGKIIENIKKVFLNAKKGRYIKRIRNKRKAWRNYA